MGTTPAAPMKVILRIATLHLCDRLQKKQLLHNIYTIIITIVVKDTSGIRKYSIYTDASKTKMGTDAYNCSELNINISKTLGK